MDMVLLDIRCKRCGIFMGVDWKGVYECRGCGLKLTVKVIKPKESV